MSFLTGLAKVIFLFRSAKTNLTIIDSNKTFILNYMPKWPFSLLVLKYIELKSVFKSTLYLKYKKAKKLILISF